MRSINFFFSGANQATEFNQLIKPLLSQPRADRRPSLDIFLYWSFSPKSSPPVYVWSFRLAFFTHRTKYCCLWLEEALYSRILLTSCVNLDISKDLQFSLPKKSSAAMVSSIFYFSISPQEEQSNQPYHISTYFCKKLICSSIAFSCANFSTNLTCICILMYKQITTGWNLIN